MASNVAHEQHLDGLTDTATLFLLSADTTPGKVPLPLLHLIGQPFHRIGQLLTLVLELLQRGRCCLIGGGAALL
jgi:hypothetical protein